MKKSEDEVVIFKLVKKRRRRALDHEDELLDRVYENMSSWNPTMKSPIE